MATKHVIRVKPRNPGIACDFCDRPLTPAPEMIHGKGWNYVWTLKEVGSAAFYYAACSECCDVEHDYLQGISACVKRARRHSRAWGNAVDKFIANKLWNAETREEPAAA